jgi:hypothetical protein
MSTYLRLYQRAPLHASSNAQASLRFSIKDIFSVAGYPCSFGLYPPFLENAPSTSPLIAKLCNDFTLVGAVNLSPLCLDIAPTNPFYGDGVLASSQGTLYGSSFGCVLSLMTDDADMRVNFSIGSDSGGSIRAPAAGAGLYGMRLMSDAVSKEHSLLLASSLDGVGILTHDRETMDLVLATLLPQATPSTNRLLYIPHDAELSMLSAKDRLVFTHVVNEASKHYAVQVCDETFFHTCFAIRKLRMRQALYEVLAHPQVTTSFSKLPQARALHASFALPLQEQPVAEEPLFDRSALLLHPTLTTQEPENLFLAAANTFDLYSLSFPTKQNKVSICVSGCNYSELLSISKLLTGSRGAGE